MSFTIFIYFWQEKAPYEAKAAKRKTEYEKVMKAYNKKQVNTFVHFRYNVAVTGSSFFYL